MRLNKSTRYALFATVEMAAAWPGEAVTAAQVSTRYRVSASVLAKVFQQLVRAGIAVGTRGTGGGYRLARGPSEVTMLNVIDVFETGPPRRRPERLSARAARPARALPGRARLEQVFGEVDELARCTFASVSFETLVAAAATDEVRPPAPSTPRSSAAGKRASRARS